MRFTLPAATLLLAGFAFSPAPATAQWFDFGLNCSSGSSIRTCASFQARSAEYLDAGETRTQLYLRVRNMYSILEDGSTGGSILTRFGVVAPHLSDTQNGDYLGGPGVSAEDPATETGDAASRWDFHRRTNSLNSDGEAPEWAIASGNETGSESEGGIKDCIGPDSDPANYFSTCAGGTPDGWVTFAFSSAGTVDMDQLQLGWGVISVSSDGTGSGDLGSFQGETCIGGDCGSQVVPEPATVALMALGLAGVGLVARRRRSAVEEMTDEAG